MCGDFYIPEMITFDPQVKLESMTFTLKSVCEPHPDCPERGTVPYKLLDYLWTLLKDEVQA